MFLSIIDLPTIHERGRGSNSFADTLGIALRARLLVTFREVTSYHPWILARYALGLVSTPVGSL